MGKVIDHFRRLGFSDPGVLAELEFVVLDYGQKAYEEGYALGKEEGYDKGYQKAMSDIELELL